MAKDDITQKLALLPKGLALSNVQSWNNVVEFFGRPVDVVIAEYFPYTSGMHKIAIAFSMSEQAKLFRAEGQVYDTLIISTADGQERKIGEPCLRVFIGRGFLTVRYEINEPYAAKEKSNVNIRVMGSVEDEVMTLSEENIMTTLQPMLNLIWDETRGKRNA
jgi:hypothetical protein